ncbi:hypothetical protein FDK12_04460 [Arthrobacter sp. NamB2]|uniref:hypothetical protein n=1 Tax=Arthrobacter sp. NamB2 TaxID=2576035 RepID=UPI0010C9F31C|nr:hypothetical protein [Arthrobacter sp. NamB2]TKV28925.1 hypothetical protein FDK12_04460 [Arthrobacter sp. NamB2]
MTENAHGGHIVNPNEGDGSTSDPNWQGDIGDQGNVIRFAEEQALINQQAGRADHDASEVVDDGGEGNYTSSEPSGSSGGYTSAQSPAEEGEYTDKDKPLVDTPEGEGDYTDRDR